MAHTPSDNDKSHAGGKAKVTPIAGSENSLAEDGAQGIDRLASTFETSARRWELVVYPSLFAFIVLASYGFYLIYSLSHDVASLARNVAVLTESIDTNMDIVAGRMTTISSNVNTMSNNVENMSSKMNNLDHMRHSMESMTQASHAMARSADNMQYTMGALNHNVGRPMSQMGSFFPW